ncbi:hypothetical protein [Nocardia neocaledoniensis]|uniref:hypothetical protein n=1 Tax=Nocardia neocaledoniensis TaxID=236511 RepID=UPI0024572F7B|nr:hypothetical protein [Nocardia neocaledoniensis]
MAKKSASELVDELSGIGEELRQLAVDETRTYVARAVEEMFLGGPKIDRRQFDNRSPEDCIFEFLAEQASLQSEPTLKAALDRLDENGITDDFRAGILFACKLFADPTFDY